MSKSAGNRSDPEGSIYPHLLVNICLDLWLHAVFSSWMFLSHIYPPNMHQLSQDSPVAGPLHARAVFAGNSSSICFHGMRLPFGCNKFRAIGSSYVHLDLFHSPTSQAQTVPVISLFTGIGGLELAVSEPTTQSFHDSCKYILFIFLLRFAHCIAMAVDLNFGESKSNMPGNQSKNTKVEQDPWCQQVLECRMSDGLLARCPIYDDVQTYHPVPGSADGVLAGFPCQAPCPGCVCFLRFFLMPAIWAPLVGDSARNSGCQQERQATGIWRPPYIAGGCCVQSYRWKPSVSKLLLMTLSWMQYKFNIQ
jgi:hypothetical protein